jgi:hypothetical protein
MNNPDSPAPVLGFETPESFRNTLEFGQFFRRLIPVLVATILLMWLIAGGILTSFGLGGVGWALGAVIAAGLGYVMYISTHSAPATSWRAPLQQRRCADRRKDWSERGR